MMLRTRREFVGLVGLAGGLFGLRCAVAQAQGSAPAVNVPLKLKNGLYYVDAKVNGNAAVLLVDTGASMTLLNRKFEGLGAGAAEGEVRGLGASAKARRVRIRLDIGKRAFSTDAAIGDFNVPDADGSLGSDVLSACGMVTFDYVAKSLLLYRGGL